MTTKRDVFETQYWKQEIPNTIKHSEEHSLYYIEVEDDFDGYDDYRYELPMLSTLNTHYKAFSAAWDYQEKELVTLAECLSEAMHKKSRYSALHTKACSDIVALRKQVETLESIIYQYQLGLK